MDAFTATGEVKPNFRKKPVSDGDDSQDWHATAAHVRRDLAALQEEGYGAIFGLEVSPWQIGTQGRQQGLARTSSTDSVTGRMEKIHLHSPLPQPRRGLVREESMESVAGRMNALRVEDPTLQEVMDNLDGYGMMWDFQMQEEFLQSLGESNLVF